MRSIAAATCTNTNVKHRERADMMYHKGYVAHGYSLVDGWAPWRSQWLPQLDALVEHLRDEHILIDIIEVHGNQGLVLVRQRYEGATLIFQLKES